MHPFYHKWKRKLKHPFYFSHPNLQTNQLIMDSVFENVSVMIVESVFVAMWLRRLLSRQSCDLKHSLPTAWKKIIIVDSLFEKFCHDCDFEDCWLGNHAIWQEGAGTTSSTQLCHDFWFDDLQIFANRAIITYMITHVC